MLRISHPYEPALLRTHLDISLSVKLRLLGVLGLFDPCGRPEVNSTAEAMNGVAKGSLSMIERSAM